ncbi:glycosyltransferase family 2 protein [Pseudomonadota bacterium]
MINIQIPDKIQKLSPFTKSEERKLTGLLSLGLVLTILFGLWWFQPDHVPQNFSGVLHSLDVLIFLALSFVVWHPIVNELFLWHATTKMKLPAEINPRSGWKVAFLTAFVPGKEPYDVLEKNLQAMVACDYPHDTWLLDEGNDPKAKSLCAQYGVNHFSRKGKPEYNTESGKFKAKTKAGNYNAWYDSHAYKYDLVAQVDVDFIPKKNYLMKTICYFSDPTVAFVGTPQIYGNTKDSWIAKGAAEQAYGFYGLIQKGMFGTDMQLFIGANHVARVIAHLTIDGYTGHIVEDHLTGMNYYAKRWKSVYVPEILAVGEGPSTWDAYFSQQMRWAYGLIDILFKHSPKLFFQMKPLHALQYFLLQQYYFGGLAQAIGVFLICGYFIFGVISTPTSLLELLIFFAPLLLIQQVIYRYLQKFYIDPQQESGWHWRGRLLNVASWPIYLMALFGVVMGKRLTYKVTPKGDSQDTDARPGLFVPHLIMGILSASAIVASLFTHRHAAQLLTFAILNSVLMFGMFFSELGQLVTSKLSILWNQTRATLSELRNKAKINTGFRLRLTG